MSRRAKLGLVAGLALIILAGAAALVAIDAFRQLEGARTRLDAARAQLTSLVSDPGGWDSHEGRATLIASLTRVQVETSTISRQLTSSLSLRAVRQLPLLRRQVDASLQVSADGITVLGVGRSVVEAVDNIPPTLRGGTVNVAGMSRMEGAFSAALARLNGLTRPTTGLWAPVESTRAQLNRDIGRLSSDLRDAREGVVIAHALSGGNGPATWLIAGQNNAEMRDQGSILSYAQLDSDEGVLDVTRHGPIESILLDSPVSVALPVGTSEEFGSLLPTQEWRSVNAWADFSLSGRVMAAMYLKATGVKVQGVVAIDVPALAGILSVVGPVPVPGVAQVLTASDATRVLLHDQYLSVPRFDQTGRQEALSEVASVLIDRLKTGSYDPAALGRVLATAVSGGHLMMWSANSQLQSALGLLHATGEPAATEADRTFHLAVESGVAAKLDYYVEPSVRMDVSVDAQGTALVTTTVTVTNTAPRGISPSYFAGPDDINSFSPGEYVGRVYLWSPKRSLVLDGVPDSGLIVTEQSTSVAPSSSSTLTFKTTIQGAVQKGRLELRLVPQPRLVPESLTVTLDAPTYRTMGQRTTRSVVWDRLETFQWRLAPLAGVSASG